MEPRDKTENTTEESYICIYFLHNNNLSILWCQKNVADLELGAKLYSSMDQLGNVGLTFGWTFTDARTNERSDGKLNT